MITIAIVAIVEAIYIFFLIRQQMQMSADLDQYVQDISELSTGNTKLENCMQTMFENNAELRRCLEELIEQNKELIATIDEYQTKEGGKKWKDTGSNTNTSADAAEKSSNQSKRQA